MTRRLILGISIAAAILQSSGTARASVLWNNGAPNITNLGGSGMSDTNQAQDFLLAVTSDLTAIRFWSLEGIPGDYTGSIFYQIVTNASGSPSSTVISSGLVVPTRLAAGTVLGFNQFQNDFTITANNVAAGTYWLELHNGPLGTTAFTDFYWSYTDLNGTNTPTNRGQEFDLNAATGWATNDQETAMQIFGAPSAVGGVPEPSTLLLTSVGLAALLLRHRRV